MSFEHVMSVPAIDALNAWPLYYVTALCYTVYIYTQKPFPLPQTHTHTIDSSYMLGVGEQIQQPKCKYNEHYRLRRRYLSLGISDSTIQKRGLIHSLCSLSLDRSVASSKASSSESTI